MDVSTERIVIDPAVSGGRPTVKGQRITVQTILEYLGAGDSIDEILHHHPSLAREDVLDCLAYAAGVRPSCTSPFVVRPLGRHSHTHDIYQVT
jgi:uncharacterized protein (DUF433 family)